MVGSISNVINNIGEKRLAAHLGYPDPVKKQPKSVRTKSMVKKVRDMKSAAAVEPLYRERAESFSPEFMIVVAVSYRGNLDLRKIDKKASSHFSKSTVDFLGRLEKETGIATIPPTHIPVKSPDCAPMDFCVFGVRKERLARRTVSTAVDLWKSCKEEWKKLPLSAIRRALQWKYRGQRDRNNEKQLGDETNRRVWYFDCIDISKVHNGWIEVRLEGLLPPCTSKTHSSVIILTMLESSEVELTLFQEGLRNSSRSNRYQQDLSILVVRTTTERSDQPVFGSYVTHGGGHVLEGITAYCLAKGSGGQEHCYLLAVGLLTQVHYTLTRLSKPQQSCSPLDFCQLRQGGNVVMVLTQLEGSGGYRISYQMSYCMMPGAGLRDRRFPSANHHPPLTHSVSGLHTPRPI
ncbi:unnamed protein product [Darwinula stevensoni]|uniref:Uncharacterized protein n=1 Tax=Darwinula stevensoni TaxID=69355 RepID=A0A7R9AA55_9CRUS|nr:unnamed protein product [Darwinula stevensoni]CAG0897828.1 unnamed protein product [Darwinula stevensoni]